MGSARRLPEHLGMARKAGRRTSSRKTPRHSPGQLPEDIERFIWGDSSEATWCSDLLFGDVAHYSTASHDDVNTLLPSHVKFFSARPPPVDKGSPGALPHPSG